MDAKEAVAAIIFHLFSKRELFQMRGKGAIAKIMAILLPPPILPPAQSHTREDEAQ